jgi:cytoskeleton protein RodZ
MNDSARVPVGETLREAREAQGFGIDDAAARLRLMRRQVEAMEAEDFGSLGEPVFARGFVRNYARLLGLAPEPLLAAMGGAPAEPVVVRPDVPPPAGSWLTSPWLLILLFGVFVLVMMPIALYWWLNSDEEEMPAVAAMGPSAMQARDPVDAAAAMPPVRAQASAEPEAAPDAASDEADTAAAPAVDGVLQLEFGGDSWVEIRDASGRMVHRQLDYAGSNAVVRGTPPFDIVIGNAAQVRMTYNDRPIDLKPFIDVTVARFTLEE